MKLIQLRDSKSNPKLTQNQRITNLFLCMLLVVVVLSACQEEEVRPEQPLAIDELAVSLADGETASFEEDETHGDITRDGDVYSVENFFQGIAGTTEDEHEANSEYYFDLSINDGGTASDHWIEFSGSANGTVSSPYTMYWTNTAFDDVTISTSTNGPITELGNNRTMWEISPSSGDYSINTTEPGWYNYHFVTHTLYPLVENGTNITLVITDDSATYAVEIQDIYYDGSPNGGFAPDNYPYLKFRYKEL